MIKPFLIIPTNAFAELCLSKYKLSGGTVAHACNLSLGGQDQGDFG
jgi:hypothetical protein